MKSRAEPFARAVARLARLPLVPALTIALAGCDPVYCANLHVDVANADGSQAPAGTEVFVSALWVPAPDAPVEADTLEQLNTDASGHAGPITVCRFLEVSEDYRVEANGGVMTLLNVRLGYPNQPDYPLRIVAGQVETFDFVGP